MESYIFKISKEQALKFEKAANRQAHIDLGISRPKHIIHKNKKAYIRKPKHILHEVI